MTVWAPRLPRWSLPLLGRELIESSNRRRTYAVRVLFVLLALAIFGSQYLSYSNLHMQLGIGGRLFDELSGCMYIGIFLLLPAMSVSSITQEKEQGTLILLMLTLMGPWQLILQKFLSVNLLMMALLLGTLPLLGICYVMGGISFSHIWYVVIGIVLTIFELSALSLAIGAWCRRTTAAIISAYFVIAGVMVIVMVLDFAGVHGLHSSLAFKFYTYSSPWLIFSERTHVAAWSFVMPLGLTTGLLAIARILLTRRLGIEGGSGILLVLRSFDRLFERTDTFLFRRKHVRDLPDIQPVWWLEVNRRSLTNARYLVRIFLPIYGLAFIIGTAAPQEISGLFGLCMALLLLPLIVIHASALAQERGQQTLDVLLSTPMSGLSVLRQKSRALARLRWGVSGCLLMLVFIQFCCLRYSDRISTLRISIWVAASILIPGICCWIALLVGVGLKNHRKAAIAAICCCIGWLFGLPLLIALISSLVTDQNLGNSTWQVLCPLFLIANTDDDELMRVLGVPGLACTLAGYVALWWGLRLGCLRWGSRWLYRSRARASQ